MKTRQTILLVAVVVAWGVLGCATRECHPFSRQVTRVELEADPAADSTISNPRLYQAAIGDIREILRITDEVAKERGFSLREKADTEAESLLRSYEYKAVEMSPVTLRVGRQTNAVVIPFLQNGVHHQGSTAKATENELRVRLQGRFGAERIKTGRQN